MKKWAYFGFIALMVFIAIRLSSTGELEDNDQPAGLDIQGHRGARGLLPENTIPAFKKALDLGVSTLEMDLAVTGDGQLVVSHEPWISPEICSTLEGDSIPEEQKYQLNIFQMTYEEVRSYDCGSQLVERFPDQEKLKVSKPLLLEVIETAESYGKEIGVEGFGYNIEIKSLPQGDTLYHPLPADFSDLVYKTISELLSWDRVTIQSFDFRVLQYFHQQYPEVRLVALVENEDSWQKNIEQLGFTPEVYSPYYEFLNEQNIAAMQQAGMLVVPWTINEEEDMRQLISWGVDGIITDYPNIAVGLKTQQ